MSSASAKNLSREKMQQLLAAVGSGPLEDTTQVNCAEYNWHQPHYFTRNELHKLEDFTKKIGKMIAQKFTTLCHGEFSVTITSTSQHFANELIGQALENKSNDYYLVFGTDTDHPSGLIYIPIRTAFIWSTQLLGNIESEEDSGRDLSLLEESLLLDISSAVVEAISGSHNNCDFKPAQTLARRLLPLELQGTEEFFKITFNVKKTDSKDSEACLFIFCDSLAPIVEKTTHDASKFSTEDISKAMFDRLQKISVSVNAQLAFTVLALQEIMDLKVDDVVLLDKRVDEPIELIVEGRKFSRGRLAKSGGSYAVVITEISPDTTQQTNPVTGT